MNNVAKTIEAVLFAEAREFSIKELAKLLSTDQEVILEALNELKEKLTDHGLVLIQNGDDVSLGTAPEVASVIEEIRKDMVQKELSKAAAETLAVILYHPGISRPEIEFIRGVNASYSLRLLLIRGLIEQKQKEGDNRVSVFYPTTDVLMHFGITNPTELPDHEVLSSQLAILLTKQQSE